MKTTLKTVAAVAVFGFAFSFTSCSDCVTCEVTGGAAGTDVEYPEACGDEVEAVEGNCEDAAALIADAECTCE